MEFETYLSAAYRNEMMPFADSGCGRDIVLGGITFRGLAAQDILAVDLGLKHIITVNAEAIVLANENPEFKRIINENFACFDGQIPLWLARYKYRAPIEKLAGSDLIFNFGRMASERGHSIFLLGDDEDTNSEACAILRGKYHVPVYGYAPPHASYPFEPEVDERIFEVLSDHRPQILLVALGVPKQEMWISGHRPRLEQIGVRWAMGIGGALGFVSGRELRAPVFVQRAGMEGIWRLFQRPSRWRRFVRVLRVLRYAAN